VGDFSSFLHICAFVVSCINEDFGNFVILFYCGQARRFEGHVCGMALFSSYEHVTKHLFCVIALCSFCDACVIMLKIKHC